MSNKVAWFEMAGPDATKLQDFYAKLFGWTVDANNPMNYGMVQDSEAGLGGGIGPSQDGSSHVTVYVDVPDLAAALKKAEELGGTIVTQPMEVPDGPTIAHFADPAGNFIGLMKTPG